MALPKKRKKLENIASNNNAAEMTSNIAPKTMQRKSAKGTTRKASSKKSEQMSKAFEIMDRIENRDDPQKTIPSDVSASPGYPTRETIKTPGRIRFRISLDRKTNTCPEHEAAPANMREIDFGITIPSIIWKIPVLKRAAEKVLLKLSTHE